MRRSTQARAGAIFAWTETGKPIKRTVFAWARALCVFHWDVASLSTRP
jgi:hypothetical protein